MFTDIETIVFSMFFLFFAVWTFFASPLIFYTKQGELPLSKRIKVKPDKTLRAETENTGIAVDY